MPRNITAITGAVFAAVTVVASVVASCSAPNAADANHASVVSAAPAVKAPKEVDYYRVDNCYVHVFPGKTVGSFVYVTQSANAYPCAIAIR